MMCTFLVSMYLMKKICDYMFPYKMKELYLRAGLYSLQLYVPVSLYVQKLYNVYRTFIMDHSREEKSSILFITDGQVINEENLSDTNILPSFNCYHLILRKERLNTPNGVYNYQYTRLNNTSSLTALPKPSTFKFLNITVCANQEKYTIDFGINNFYIEGNILFDKVFLQWYLKQFFKVDLPDTYTCILMDQNINFITFGCGQHILIRKEDYILANTEANVVRANVVGANVVGSNVVDANVMDANVVEANTQ